MGSPRRSLNDRILWLQVLDALDVPTPSQALPSVTKCPFCHTGRLMILQDHLAGGQWHWCRSCHQGGDMIELAAKVWKMNIPATIAKLATKGLTISADRDNIRVYIEQHVNNRRKLQKLWKQARDQFVNGSTSAQRLVHALRIGCDVSHERLDSGMGQLVGSIAAETVQATLIGDKTGEKIFRDGKQLKWQDVLTIPFYDLPERICGFLFIGKNGRSDKDFIFRRTNIATRLGLQHGAKHVREGGLAMHPNVLDASTEWGGVVFCLADPVRALQLHARHLGVSLRPLPIVAWYPSDAISIRYSWQMFTGKHLVMWAPTLTRHIIQQAIRTGAKISTIGPRADLEEDLDQYVWRRTTEELLQEIRDSAEPWPRVVARHFDSLADTDLEELLMELQLGGLDLNKILKKCPPQSADRLAGIINQQPVGRTIGMDSKVVVERSGGWYTEGQRADQWELIMDAQLRIDFTIWQQRSRVAMYQGRIIHQGLEVPFCVDMATLEKRPFEFLRELLLPHGKFLASSPKWNSRVVAIAVQFQSPKVIQGAEVVGWDIARLAFVLPKYRIEVGGEVKKNKGVFPPGSPGEDMPEVEAMSGQDLHPLLTDDAASQMLWASATSLLANILAPAFRQPTAGIGTVGSAISDVARAVTEDFGCLTHKITAGEGAPEKLRAREREHRWPIWVEAAKTSKALTHFVDDTKASNPYHNCIVPLNWYVATVKRLQGGWHILESAEVGGVTPEARAALRRLVPAYLLDLAERRWKLDGTGGNGNWWSTVLDDLTHYINKFGGDGEQIQAARSMYSGMNDGDTGNAEALADLTSQLVKEGKFALVPDGFQDAKIPSLLRVEGVFEHDAITIPKQALVEWAAVKHMVLDCSKVTASLAKADVLLEDGDDFWAVPESWWMSRMKQTQNAQTGLLRLRA